MKRVLALVATATLATAALPALAQTSVEGETDTTVTIKPADDAGQAGAQAGAESDTTVTGSINLSTDQQAEARTILMEGASPSNVDVTLDIGATVPDTVTLVPLPPRFVTLVPEYEGYEYFLLADGRIVIVKPDTKEVVYILS